MTNSDDELVEAAKAIFSVCKNMGRTWDDCPQAWRDVCLRDAGAARPVIRKAALDEAIAALASRQFPAASLNQFENARAIDAQQWYALTTHFILILQSLKDSNP